MNIARLPSSRLLKLAAIVALIAGSTFGVGGQRHRASVSSDLLSFEGRRTTARTRVIVRGSRAQIQSMAARHGLAVARWMGDGAVVLADSRQVTNLAADSANGVLTAVAMRCLNGEIYARLVVRTPQDEARCAAMGITDLQRIYRAADLAPGRHLIFAATGVTEGALMKGVRFFRDGTRTA